METSFKIDQENENLLTLIRDNKNLEMAKQVTSLYEGRFTELMKLFPDGKQDPYAELASIYSYLWAKNSKETALRLLLAVCLGEVLGECSD
jgi:hypothetical protein